MLTWNMVFAWPLWTFIAHVVALIVLRNRRKAFRITIGSLIFALAWSGFYIAMLAPMVSSDRHNDDDFVGGLMGVGLLGFVHSAVIFVALILVVSFTMPDQMTNRKLNDAN